jgi:hypothetical protein
MRRRINSTGRKSIGRSLISLRIVEPAVPSLPRSFTADLSGLATLQVAQNSRVYVEPYVTGSSSLMRFDFGTIGALSTPTDTHLSDLDAGGRILFRIKVVDESGDVGKILASINALRPTDEKISDNERRAILPVASDDLGEAVWKLDFPTPERPLLVVNNRIPGLLDRIKVEPLLQGAIIPAAIRQILRVVLDPDNGSIDDELDWVQDWKLWASNMLGKDGGEDIEDTEELERRLDELCDQFTLMCKFATKLETVTA